MGIFSQGLTNHQTEDIGKMMGKEIQYWQARCFSAKCTGNNNNGAIKQVERGKTICPDCARPLVWRRKGKKRVFNRG